jgi:hypothetical protein
MRQTGESDLPREYSIISEISECVPNFKSVSYVICQSCTLKMCLFLGTTVHKRNCVRLRSGVATFFHALLQYAILYRILLYWLCTSFKKSVHGLLTNYVTMMTTPWTCGKNVRSGNVSMEWECECEVGM